MFSQVRVIILNYLRWGNVDAIVNALHPYCKITVINNLVGHSYSNEHADVINNDSNKKCMIRWHATYDYPEPYKLILDDEKSTVENVTQLTDFVDYNNLYEYLHTDIKRYELIKNTPLKSKMSLNLSQGEPLKFYSSDRLAQLVGNGILTFIDVKTGLNKLFSNKEVVFYKDIKDLSKKINFYKNSHNIRNKIAKNGMKKYHKYMNSTIIASYIINKTLNINKNIKYYWENK